MLEDNKNELQNDLVQGESEDHILMPIQHK